MEKLTQADIDEIRKKKGQARHGKWKATLSSPSGRYQLDSIEKASPFLVADWMSKVNAEYVVTLHNHAEALLKAAEYGMKAQKFFAYMKAKDDNRTDMDVCEGCLYNTVCSDGYMMICGYTLDAAKAVGLLEGE